MITIEQSPNLVNVAVLGEFTLADFKQFEDEVVYELKSPGTMNLLFDMRAMLKVSIDVVWEEIKFFSKEHHYDFNKIAVVTEDPMLTWEAVLSRLFVDADIEVFGDYPTAQAWASA
ncbi:MAG: STAS/SEC14 domain-containing protein [Gallionella sp.]|nr:STAS/SEC14 domain-containing protein [Gallionella sp.]